MWRIILVCTALTCSSAWAYIYTNDPVSSSWGSSLIWYDDRIELAFAWNYTKGHPDILVGSVDIGVDWHHVNDASYGDLLRQDLGGNYDIDSDWDERQNDEEPYDLGPGEPETLTWYHGTQVLGVIGARSNNGRGIYSIAGGWGDQPGVRVAQFRTEAVYYDDWETGNAIDSAASRGARIINIGYRAVDGYYTRQKIEKAVEDFGCLVVAGSGNYNTGVFSPAALSRETYGYGIVAVGGINSAWYRWYISPDMASNYGYALDVVAPADSVGTLYSYYSGDYNPDFDATSAASAITSGVAALVWSINPTLTNEEVKKKLCINVRKSPHYQDNGIGPYGNRNDYMGYGIVDAYEAVLDASVGTLTTNRTFTRKMTLPDGLTLHIASGTSHAFEEDVTIEGTVNVESGVTLTFEKNLTIKDGGTLTVPQDSSATLVFTGGDLTINEGGMLTLNNSLVKFATGKALTIKGDLNATDPSPPPSGSTHPVALPDRQTLLVSEYTSGQPPRPDRAHQEPRRDTGSDTPAGRARCRSS